MKGKAVLHDPGAIRPGATFDSAGFGSCCNGKEAEAAEPLPAAALSDALCGGRPDGFGRCFADKSAASSAGDKDARVRIGRGDSNAAGDKSMPYSLASFAAIGTVTTCSSFCRSSSASSSTGHGVLTSTSVIWRTTP